jgi:hypothetical protein
MALLASVVANSLPEPSPFVQAPAVVQIDRQGHVVTPTTSTQTHTIGTPAPPKPAPNRPKNLAKAPRSSLAPTQRPALAEKSNPSTAPNMAPPRTPPSFRHAHTSYSSAMFQHGQMTEIAMFQAQQQTEYAAEHTELSVEQSTGLGAQQSAGQSKGPARHSCGFGSNGGTPHP